MPINHNLEFEVNTSGVFKSGACYNLSNSVGLNYSYGVDAELITISDLSLANADPFKPGIPSWTLSNGGSFPSGNYYIGIRYICYDGENNVRAYSELVEYAGFIPSGKTLVITSPSSVGYPFTHYQVFIRTNSGSFTYAQFQNYGGGLGSVIGVNLQLNTFSTAFDSIPVADLPKPGNCYLLGSISRNFISNDIGNFIFIENNNIGFRKMLASEVDNVYFTEFGKTSSENLAAWFEIDETKNIKQISVVMWAVGSPSGDLFLELREDNSGVPSDTVLDSGGLNANTLGTSPQWIDVSVNSNLVAGKYWIVIRFDSSPDINNYLIIGKKNSVGFLDLNNQHLFQFNTITSTWSNIDDGIAVAIGVTWNSNEVWGEGDFSSFLVNKGSLRLEILNIDADQALVCSDFYITELGNNLGTGYLGGSSNNLLSIIEHSTTFAYHGTIHLQESSYVISSPLNLVHTSIYGYSIEHYDLSNRPTLIADDTIDPSIFSYPGGYGLINLNGDDLQISNIIIDGNNFAGKLLTATDYRFLLDNCYFKNSIHSGIIIGAGTNKAIYIEKCQFSNISGNTNQAAAIYLNNLNHVIINHTYFNDIIGSGILAFGPSLRLEFCIFHNISGSFTNNGNAIVGEQCEDVRINFVTFNNCSKSGVHFRKNGSFVISNSLFANGGDHGIIADLDYALAFSLSKVYNNAFYNISGNQYEVNPPLLNQIDSITLTSFPFIHVGNDYVDFTLNTVTGSGAELIGKGLPQSFDGTNSVQKLDIGAVQNYGNQPLPRRNPIISLY